jgi:predicted lactoylglutathione lyase
MSFFVNLPVTDVDRSRAFYTAVGWTINEQMSDQNAVCVVAPDDVHLMLSRRDFFESLGDGRKQVGDPSTTSMLALAFDFPSRDDVDAFVAKDEGAGARIGGTDDYGFMYQRDFDDPDGHQFAPFWMSPDGPPKG